MSAIGAGKNLSAKGSFVARGIAIIASCLMMMPVHAATSRPVPVDLELVLAVDVSGSVDEAEALLQRQGYVEAIADPAVVGAITSGMLGRIAVTYVEWAGDGWQEFLLPWTLIDSARSAETFAATLAEAPITAGPWTSISDAIRATLPLFEENNFEGTRRIIDISGDGPNNSGGLVEPERDLAVAQRVTINGLPIINDRFNFFRPPMPNLDLYYRNCVIGGPGAFLIVAHGFKSFAQAIRRKLILEIAGDMPENEPSRPIVSGHAQAAGAPAKTRWVPPCDEGEKRFRGMIGDE